MRLTMDSNHGDTKGHLQILCRKILIERLYTNESEINNELFFCYS